MSVIVIGKNSFIAQNLLKCEGCEDWTFLSHIEALENDVWTRNATTVINCAFSPQLYKQPYQEEWDLDTKIAQTIKNLPDIHYVVLSSRLVYGEAENLVETSLVNPSTEYGRSKKTIEDNVTEILGTRALILRCSNIFGFEMDRTSFLGSILRSLKTDSTVRFNIDPHTKKDFLPVSVFCDLLKQIPSKKLHGIYNIGSGYSVECQDIAQWVIDGYGEGNITTTGRDVAGQFFMDISKLKAHLDFPDTSPSIVKQACIEIGQTLKTA